MTTAGVIQALVETAANSQSDKRYASAWQNLIKDFEKAAKEVNRNKPDHITVEEWAMLLAHRTRKGSKPKQDSPKKSAEKEIKKRSSKYQILQQPLEEIEVTYQSFNGSREALIQEEEARLQPIREAADEYGCLSKENTEKFLKAHGCTLKEFIEDINGQWDNIAGLDPEFIEFKPDKKYEEWVKSIKTKPDKEGKVIFDEPESFYAEVIFSCLGYGQQD